MDKWCRDKHTAILPAMHKLQSVVQPHGPAHVKVEALALTTRTTKMHLKNVNLESQLFADCHTVGKLVSKLDQSMQDKLCHYRALKLQLPEHVSYEAWIKQEGRAAAQHRKCAFAVEYQAIQKTSGHAGDSSVESMEQVEAKKLMKARSLVLRQARDISGAQHALISPKSNKRWRKRVK